MESNPSQAPQFYAAAIAYLEKQKEPSMSAEEVLIKAGLKPYKDGNKWCILAGDNIQEGICGFGDTIDEALYQFLMEVCDKQKEQKPAECASDSAKFDEGFKTGREVGFREGVASVKPAEWSEEDKEMLDAMIDIVSNSLYEPLCPREGMLAWLKSLRPQSKQEWSKEDEEKIDDIIRIICDARELSKIAKIGEEEEDNSAFYDGLVLFLKSLRPQPISQSSTNHTVWHNASEEKPTKLPIIHIWYHGNRVSTVVAHENIGLQEELDDINFQPDDKWAYVEDLLNVQHHWKPSKYILSLVKKVADGEMLTGVEQMAMGTLHEELKKLSI